MTRPEYYRAFMVNFRDASQKSIPAAFIFNRAEEVLTEAWVKIHSRLTVCMNQDFGELRL
jgi:hypothetical protein